MGAPSFATPVKVIVSDSVVELTQEQIDLFNAISTDLQKKAALKSLEGLSDAEAYRQAGGKASTPGSMSASASEILNNPNVVAFKQSFSGYLIASSIMTRREMLERLTVMARTTITDVVDINNYVLAEGEDGKEIKQSSWSLKDADNLGDGASSISELTATKEGMKIKLHDQKVAMKQIADLEGYNAAVRLAIGGDPLGKPITYSDMSDDQLMEELSKYGIKP